MIQSKKYYDEFIEAVNKYSNNHTIRNNQSIPITLYHQNTTDIVAKHKIKIYQQPTMTSNIVTYTKYVDCPTFESNTAQQSFNFDSLQGTDASIDGTLSVISPIQPMPGDPFTTHSDSLHVYEIVSSNKTNINNSMNMYDVTYRKKAIDSVTWFEDKYTVSETKWFARELNVFLTEPEINKYRTLFEDRYQTNKIINDYEQNDYTDFLIREISKGTSTHTLRFVDYDVSSVDLSDLTTIQTYTMDYPVLYDLYILEQRRLRC